MSEYTIREANGADVDEIVKIERENNSSLWKSESYQSAIKQESQQIYVVEKGEEPIIAGYLVGLLAADELTLMHVVVAQEHRQQGLAAKLYHHWLAEVQQANEVKTVWLEVRTSNIAAQSLYKKLGFELVTVRRGYYSNPKEDAFLMRSEMESLD